MMKTISFSELGSEYNQCYTYISGIIHQGFQGGSIFSGGTICTTIWMGVEIYPNKWLLKVGLNGISVDPFRIGIDNNQPRIHINYAGTGHYYINEGTLATLGSNAGTQCIQLLKTQKTEELFYQQIKYWKESKNLSGTF